MLERRLDLVAGGIARVGADRRIDILIVPQRKESDAEGRIGEADG